MKNVIISYKSLDNIDWFFFEAVYAPVYRSISLEMKFIANLSSGWIVKLWEDLFSVALANDITFAGWYN